MATIKGHAPTIHNGEINPLDAGKAAKIERWRMALEKATTPERRAAVQLEIDKLTGLAGVSKEDRIAILEAELAKLKGE